ncbi:MAG: BamA/TamA family outer membrane protein [Candidatus Sericytochromatia bacterium]
MKDFRCFLPVFLALILAMPAVQAQESPTPAPTQVPVAPSPSPSSLNGAEGSEVAGPAPTESAQPTPAPDASASPAVEEPAVQADTMKIVEIDVVGTAYKDAVLLSMFTKPGDDVSAEQIRNDLRRIYGLGYFLDVTATRQPAEGGFKLVVMVQENPVLREVRILNETQVFTREQLLDVFKEQVGKTANFNDIRELKEKLEEAYRQRGYALASLRIMQNQTEENGGLLSPEGVLELQLNEGLIEDIRVSGNLETKDYVVLREITLKPGELFDSNQMQGDLRRVFNTNFFESMNLLPKPGEKDPNHWILVVEVKEKPTGAVNLGAGYNNRDGLIGTFSINKDNLMGEGRRLGVDLQFGVNLFSIFTGANFTQAQRTLLGRIDFYDPWMFEGRTSFGASIFSERVPLFFGTGNSQQSLLNLSLGLGNGIIQRRVGTSLSFGRPLFGDLTSPWRGSLSVRAEQVGVTDLLGEPKRELSVSNRFSATDVFFSVGGSLSYDTRDIIIDPKSGWYGLFSFEPVWGDTAYLKLAGNLSTYFAITDWLTLAVGVRGGTFLGQNPPYELFYSNGFNVIRGWPENGFLYGKHFGIGSVELRFPIFNPVSGVLFTDIGEFLVDPNNRAAASLGLNTTNSEQNQGLPFKYGVGLGIRLNTPMGPLRLDYGVRDFSRINFGTLFDAGQLHFSIGQKF